MHDLDPFALRFSGEFGIRWYGLSYAAGFLIAWWVLGRLARKHEILPRPEQVGDLMLGVIVGTIVGGRLGYVLIYRPELLWEFSARFPYWGLLDMLHGGMASHGGMIGIILALAWCARRMRLPALHLMDCVALVAPAGIFLGRLANFVNGELLGRIVVQPADEAAGVKAPWWGVRFPQELTEPGRAAEVVFTPEQEMQLGGIINRHAQPGDVTTHDVGVRLLDRIHQGGQDVARELEPFISVRHPSQLYQAFAEGIVLGVALWLIRLWTRRRGQPGGGHGLILAWFFVIYGVGRVVTELWRLPDAHLAAPRMLGLSRGQWLSVGMIAAGMVLVAVVSRKKGTTRISPGRA